jgi:hypothetical protein
MISTSRPSALSQLAKPVDGDALHAATENFGKCRLICAAEPRRFLLRQFALLDGVLDGDYHAAFGGEFLRLGWREPNIPVPGSFFLAYKNLTFM